MITCPSYSPSKCACAVPIVLDMSEDIMSYVKDMDDEQLEALKQCIRDAEQARKAEEVSEAVDDGEKNDTEEPVGEDMD